MNAEPQERERDEEESGYEFDAVWDGDDSDEWEQAGADEDWLRWED